MDPMQFLLNFQFQTAMDEIIPVAQFVLGMTLYSVFIFKFYRFLAKRDIFEINYSKYSPDWSGTMQRAGMFILHVLSYLVLFPLFVILWFGAVVILLVFLSRTQSIESVLIISVSLVTAVRITSYYTEELSRDLAKMLPFALLGIFIVESSYFSFDASITLLQTIPLYWEKIAYYCIFVVLLEFVLRIIRGIKIRVFPKKKKEEETAEEEKEETTEEVSS